MVIDLHGARISIHAPAKGATLIPISIIKCRQFQSTLPRRERQITRMHHWKTYLNFNPRSREGSDSCLFQLTVKPYYFNPRSREGSDNICILFSSNVPLFQSTLPRRERHCKKYLSLCQPLFQSTLPRRERQLLI